MSALVPQRLQNLATARRRFGDRVDRLLPFFLAGDPLADAAVEALAGLDRAARAALLDRCFDRASGAALDAPAAVHRLFEELDRRPFWVDLARCSRGGLAFLRTGPLGGITLGFGALPASYCSSGGNKPLVFSGRLLESAYRRMVETGEFIYAVSQPGALAPRAAGWKALVKVRLLHAQIRGRLLQDPRWQSDQWGLPINQADMAATTLLFSHVVAIGVRKLGGRVSRAEEEDLLHLWRYAGYLLGVDEQLLCASAEEAKTLAALITTIDAGPDDDSRRLVGAMLDPRIFERKIRDPRLARSLRALYQAVCRMFLGDERADRVGLPRAPALDLALRGSRPLLLLASTAVAALPFNDSLRLRGGSSYWQRFIAEGALAGTGTETAHGGWAQSG